MVMDEDVSEILQSNNPLQAAVEHLFDTSEHYHWVGIYIVKGDVLELGPFKGPPTEHVRIPVSKGICGAAVREQRSINIQDVMEDSRFIACSISTRSELVVPIWHGGKVVGEIDIDSDEPSAFKAEDEARVKRIAEAIAPYIENYSNSD